MSDPNTKRFADVARVSVTPTQKPLDGTGTKYWWQTRGKTGNNESKTKGGQYESSENFLNSKWSTGEGSLAADGEIEEAIDLDLPSGSEIVETVVDKRKIIWVS